jgi:hypothetical protein
LEIERKEFCREPKDKNNPRYHKGDNLALQSFLRNILNPWVGNGGCVVDLWKKFNDNIFEDIL